MVRDENYTPPFDVDLESSVAETRFPIETDEPQLDGDDSNDLHRGDDEWDAAKQAWDESLSSEVETLDPLEDDAISAEALADPFVGRWNRLISSTNWEKGRIIYQWRQALIDAGAAPTDFSDEAWARCVGGVTASHVGRLRRVYDGFNETYETYPGLYWTHFLIALDWDDAPLWLEGASQGGWSVSQMRNQRWEAIGGNEAERPTAADLTGDLDEDFDAAMAGGSGSSDIATSGFTQPGQGGGSTKEYGDGPNGVGSGPSNEGPDFGDEESLNRLSDDFQNSPSPTAALGDQSETPPPLVQPFAGLPELPSDLADAVELLKLAVLRHKTAGWKEVSVDVVLQYLKAFNVLVEARGR